MVRLEAGGLGVPPIGIEVSLAIALDEDGGAGTLDAVARGFVDASDRVRFAGEWADASEALGFAGGVGWRRAVEVFIVLFEGLEALSFTCTRRVLRE